MNSPQESSAGVTKSPSRTTYRRPPVPALTGLRYFAAASVLVVHLTPGFPATIPYAVSNLINIAGRSAVSFFFILSGFILIYSDLDGAGRMSKTRRSFWFARFGRIYPVYFFAFLLAGPATFWGLQAHHGTQGALMRMAWYGPMTALLLQSWLPWTAASWNAPGWSLSCEAFFYALFPRLTALYRLSYRSLAMVLVGVWILTSLPGICLHLVYPDAMKTPLLVRYAWEYNPLLRIPEFIGGMIGGVFWIRLHSPSDASANHASAKETSWPLLGILTAILVFMLFGVEWMQRAVLFPLFLALVYRLARDRSSLASFFGLPALVALGEASYALYIIHIPLWVYVSRLLHRPQASFGLMGLYLVLVTLVALLVHRWLEMPGVRWVRKRFVVSASMPGPADVRTLIESTR